MKRGELTDIEGIGNGRYGAGYEAGMAASPADSGHKDDPGRALHALLRGSLLRGARRPGVGHGARDRDG